MMPCAYRVLGDAGLPARRVAAVFAVLIFGLLGNREARAQVDTSAAHDARAAIRDLRRDYRSRPTWSPWASYINLEDLEYELQAGDRAQGAAIELAVARLAEEGLSSGPVSKRLATALATRAQEVAPIPADQWPAECYRQAEQYASITPDAVQKARVTLQDRLIALERRLPALRRPADPWSKYLFWPETRALVRNDTPDPALLDRLESRWHAAIGAWDAYEMVEASLAVRLYIGLFRGYLAHESQEQHAAAWNELGGLLESYAQAPASDTSGIAAAINGRERLGEGTSLTASIRRELSRPNVILQVRIPWLQAQLAQTIKEPYTVNDVYAGARTTGSGTLTASTRCEVLPSNAVGQWLFHFEGTSRANTTGGSDGVSVASHSTTKINGVKPLTLEAGGLVPKPATANANTVIVYDRINAGGRSRRRSEAISQTNARRPQAEREASASARRFVMERMDTEGKDLAEKFNKSYRAQIRDSQFDTHRTAPEVRVRSADDVLRWECRLEGLETFAVASPPPEFDPDADVVLSIAASALEDQGLALLGDKQLTADELSKVVGELMGESGETEKSGQDFTAKFAPHPCDIQLVDGQIHTRLYIMSFESADVQYPAMTVDVQYNVEQRSGDLALVRQGSVHVKPLAQGEGAQQVISGRQQTLRLAVQRKLNKAMAEQFLWTGFAMPTSSKEDEKLHVKRAQVDGGWLQMALSRGGKDEG